jgi:hypothetical protein
MGGRTGNAIRTGGNTMKVWKVNIDVFVVGDNRLDAISNLTEELDYVFKLDTKLQAYSDPIHAELEHETED